MLFIHSDSLIIIYFERLCNASFFSFNKFLDYNSDNNNSNNSNNNSISNNNYSGSRFLFIIKHKKRIS